MTLKEFFTGKKDPINLFDRLPVFWTAVLVLSLAYGIWGAHVVYVATHH